MPAQPFSKSTNNRLGEHGRQDRLQMEFIELRGGVHDLSLSRFVNVGLLIDGVDR